MPPGHHEPGEHVAQAALVISPYHPPLQIHCVEENIPPSAVVFLPNAQGIGWFTASPPIQ